MINKNYIFQITFQGNITPVFPLLDDFVIQYEPQDEEIFYRKKINTAFVFTKDDFQLLYNIEQSCDRCELIGFEIYRKCLGGQFLIFEGRLNLNEGKWNPYKCELSITPQSLDEYSCMEQNSSIEKNIINGTTKEIVQQFIGEIECQECTQSINGFFLGNPKTTGAQCNPPLNPSEGWTVSNNKIQQSAGEFGISTTITTLYCREYYVGTTQPPGLDWVVVSGGFARPVNAVFTADKTTNISPSQFVKEYFFSIPGYTPESEDEDGNTIPATTFEYDNAIPLEDVLNLWLLSCGLTIKSDFFNINPTGDAPNNAAYTFASQNLHHLFIYQVTDILNGDATENATIANLKLVDFLRNIKTIFNVRWKIVGNQLVLEHLSYFEAQNGLDISNEISIKGKTAYEYKSDSLAQFEAFNWMNEVSDYFMGQNIQYTSFCTKFGESVSRDADSIITDLGYVIANVEDINKGGFFLMSAISFNGEYFVNNDNKSLSWTELHHNLYLWGRLQLEGQINGANTAFESAIRLKKQEQLEVPFCCEIQQNFDPADLIKTQLGWGEIEQASFSAKNSFLQLDILHDQNCE